ncbi:MAG: hypothetical protein AAGA76_13165 [Pseudomonadota bacterium]
MKDIEIFTDLSIAERLSRKASQLLIDIREEHDLSAWEFTKNIRIAPFEIPHSHPVLTLNTRNNEDPDAFLAVYLHEQIHWGISLHRQQEVDELINPLHEYYPSLQTSNWGVAPDIYSTYLHIVVNWLEVYALSGFLGDAAAEETVRRSPVYQKIYDLVLKDSDKIQEMLEHADILPFPSAELL